MKLLLGCFFVALRDLMNFATINLQQNYYECSGHGTTKPATFRLSFGDNTTLPYSAQK